MMMRRNIDDDYVDNKRKKIDLCQDDFLQTKKTVAMIIIKGEGS